MTDLELLGYGFLFAIILVAIIFYFEKHKY